MKNGLLKSALLGVALVLSGTAIADTTPYKYLQYNSVNVSNGSCTEVVKYTQENWGDSLKITQYGTEVNGVIDLVAGQFDVIEIEGGLRFDIHQDSVNLVQSPALIGTPAGADACFQELQGQDITNHEQRVPDMIEVIFLNSSKFSINEVSKKNGDLPTSKQYITYEAYFTCKTGETVGSNYCGTQSSGSVDLTQIEADIAANTANVTLNADGLVEDDVEITATEVATVVNFDNTVSNDARIVVLEDFKNSQYILNSSLIASTSVVVK